MGGIGSGRRSRRATTSDYDRVDVRHWQREGWLVPAQSFIWQSWVVTVGPSDRDAASDRVSFRPRNHGAEHSIRLEWTPCNYGGSRVWFLCPREGCGRRVAILYEGRQLGCRNCLALVYCSQREPAKYRPLNRAQAIRMKIGGSADMTEPFPARPKGMHLRTYRRLHLKAQVFEAIFLAGLVALVKRFEEKLPAARGRLRKKR